MIENFTLIGIDGGASKVSGRIVRILANENNFTLSTFHSEMNYAAVSGFISDFKPLAVPVQLQQREDKIIQLTTEEIQQSSVYIDACTRVIIDLAQKGKAKAILVGIGMPGLKTEDRRGICVLANGPRMIDYAAQVEAKVKASGIRLLCPIYHLGSDADYCGIGEKFAREGSFRNINNAYYLGGGTGAADALLLHKELVPFDQTKNWLAKTWEMKSESGISAEKYVSAAGLQSLYALLANRSVEELNLKKIFPQQIARLALKGDSKAAHTFAQAAYHLSLLLFERITTLYCGWQSLFQFVNPGRQPLNADHPYRCEIFNRLVIGQRLGEFLQTEAGKTVLLTPLRNTLSYMIFNSAVLPRPAINYYLVGKRLRSKILVLSGLREAPALGAGIDAYQIYQNRFSRRNNGRDAGSGRT